MKVLTVQQPFAHLIALGEKRVENRTWATRLVGRLAIHAGNSRIRVSPDVAARFPNLAFGAIVAVVRLAGCASVEDIRAGRLDDRFPGLSEHGHVEGPFCWIFTNPRRLANVIPVRGQLGLWDYDGVVR